MRLNWSSIRWKIMDFCACQKVGYTNNNNNIKMEMTRNQLLVNKRSNRSIGPYFGARKLSKLSSSWSWLEIKKLINFLGAKSWQEKIFWPGGSKECKNCMVSEISTFCRPLSNCRKNGKSSKRQWNLTLSNGGFLNRLLLLKGKG